MSEFAILAGFFLFVMTGVVLAGFAFGVRTEQEGPTSALTGPRTFLAQAFQRLGESVPTSESFSHPMRNLLLSAGYRSPAAVQVFLGIRWAAALLLVAVTVLFCALRRTDFFAGIISEEIIPAFGDDSSAGLCHSPFTHSQNRGLHFRRVNNDSFPFGFGIGRPYRSDPDCPSR